MSDNIYVELAEHLDKAHAGAPMSPTLLKILEILYPGEEPEVALKLSIYERKALADVEALLPDKAGRLEGILDDMAHRGTVMTERKPGRETYYRLLPSVVGFSEVPYLDGVDTPVKRELAPLWREYIENEYGREMARGIPLIRVVPIAESLEDQSQVLPFDAIARKLDEASFMAVGHCPCRQISKYTGEGCDRPTERCMHFGALGRYIVDMGKARQIDKREALDILRKATEEGLVHVCDNLEGSLRTICNCCPCCCAFFRVNNRQRPRDLLPLQLPGSRGSGRLHRLRHLRGPLPGERHHRGGPGRRGGRGPLHRLRGLHPHLPGRRGHPAPGEGSDDAAAPVAGVHRRQVQDHLGGESKMASGSDERTGRKAESRERILASAGSLVREKGIAGASVSGVMEGAGMTVGGFYAHFPSKRELVAETVGEALRQSRGNPGRGGGGEDRGGVAGGGGQGLPVQVAPGPPRGRLPPPGDPRRDRQGGSAGAGSAGA